MLFLGIFSPILLHHWKHFCVDLHKTALLLILFLVEKTFAPNDGKVFPQKNVWIFLSVMWKNGYTNVLLRFSVQLTNPRGKGEKKMRKFSAGIIHCGYRQMNVFRLYTCIGVSAAKIIILCINVQIDILIGSGHIILLDS